MICKSRTVQAFFLCGLLSTTANASIKVDSIYTKGAFSLPLGSSESAFNQGDPSLEVSLGTAITVYRDFYIDAEATMPPLVGNNTDSFSSGTELEIKSGFARQIVEKAGIDFGVKYYDTLEFSADDIDLYAGVIFRITETFSAGYSFNLALHSEKDSYSKVSILKRFPSRRFDMHLDYWTADYPGTGSQIEAGGGMMVGDSWYLSLGWEADMEFSERSKIEAAIRYDFL